MRVAAVGCDPANLDTVNDLKATTRVDFSDISRLEPAFVIYSSTRVLLVYNIERVSVIRVIIIIKKMTFVISCKYVVPAHMKLCGANIKMQAWSFDFRNLYFASWVWFVICMITKLWNVYKLNLIDHLNTSNSPSCSWIFRPRSRTCSTRFCQTIPVVIFSLAKSCEWYQGFGLPFNDCASESNFKEIHCINIDGCRTTSDCCYSTTQHGLHLSKKIESMLVKRMKKKTFLKTIASHSQLTFSPVVRSVASFVSTALLNNIPLKARLACNLKKRRTKVDNL